MCEMWFLSDVTSMMAYQTLCSHAIFRWYFHSNSFWLALSCWFSNRFALRMPFGVMWVYHSNFVEVIFTEERKNWSATGQSLYMWCANPQWMAVSYVDHEVVIIFPSNVAKLELYSNRVPGPLGMTHKCYSPTNLLLSEMVMTSIPVSIILQEHRLCKQCTDLAKYPYSPCALPRSCTFRNNARNISLSLIHEIVYTYVQYWHSHQNR